MQPHGLNYGENYFSQLLVQKGHLTSDSLNEVLDIQKKKGGKLKDILQEQNYVNEKDLLNILSEQLDIPLIEHLDNKAIPDELIALVPINFAKQYKLVPMGYQDNNSILIASADPLSIDAIDDISILLQAQIELQLTTQKNITNAINSAYDRGTAHAAAAMEEMTDESLDIFAHEFEEAIDLLDSEDEAPIIRLVNSLISQAVKEHASDIHIEPAERHLVVRFRIDGILYEKIKPPKKLQASIISRIKIQAELNIAEKRLPQDGRIRIKIAGKDIDIRVATAPTSYGERITMRLLDRSAILLDLTDLGFSPENHQLMNKLVKKSHGILLVTGPTGSGKTTTLYSCLSSINEPDLNILTIEDPVEYQLTGISQTQTNPKINLNFASGLRSFLRHDPDVIMVGEIRDLETAEISIQAALTGHLVLSTLHTNDAASAITRLVDMGVEPFLVASSVIGIMAQRLVRTICKKCCESYIASEEELKELGLNFTGINEKKPKFYRGVGCESCLNTGYQGRIGIHEVLIPTHEIKQLILQNMDSGTIKKQALKEGMSTLRSDGATKVFSGITSSSEVLRVTQLDKG